MNPAVRFSRFRPIHTDDLIRVGTKGDGGYVISKRCITHTTLLLSFGIGDNWSFDVDFLRKNPSASCVGIDGSVSFLNFFKKALRECPKCFMHLRRLEWNASFKRFWTSLSFIKNAICFCSFFHSFRNHYINKFIDDAPGPRTITIQELFNSYSLVPLKNPGPFSLFIKMDIEGFEYNVLPHLFDLSDRINGMAIEFHNSMENWALFTDLVERLQKQYAIVHVHGNNASPLLPGTGIPSVLEISFVNRHLLPVAITPSLLSYPVPSLDYPCDHTKPEYTLSFES